MSINISVYIFAGIVIISIMAGFWLGRSIKWMMSDTEERVSGGVEGAAEREEPLHVGRALCSPVSGCLREDAAVGAKGVVLQPEQGLVYAPVSGKIMKLFPLGNRMLIRSDGGIELLLSVGEPGDEMHSEYYRSHVMQNEIVPKGKMLLEFDLEKMCGDGVDTMVSLMVEGGDGSRDIALTRKRRVKSGEEILWVREHAGLA